MVTNLVSDNIDAIVNSATADAFLPGAFTTVILFFLQASISMFTGPPLETPMNFKFGILFGCESSGLSNEDLINANQLIYIPSNYSFSSLNLSHAVTIVCWEFFKYFMIY